MREQRFRREHPEATEFDVEAFMHDWLLDRPGAPDGDAAAETLVFELVRAGYRVVASMEHAATGRLSTVRLSEDGLDRSVVIDLLFASSGIESEVVGHADIIDVLPRLRLPVATIGDLVALKLLSRDDERRPNDAADLRSLAVVATDADWDRALTSVRLILERGYSRQRDLEAELVRLRATRFGP